MKKIVVVVVVAAGAVAVAPGSGAASGVQARGVVVGKERAALLVASPTGVVRSVAGRARLGARVTIAAGRARVVGRAHSTRLRGVVIRRVGSTVFLASNHHLLAMASERPAASALKPGEIVTTSVSIGNGELDENEAETEDVGEEQFVQVQALVTAVAPGALTVAVNGQPLVIRLPAELTLPQSLVGQTVTIRLELQQENVNEDEDDDAADNSATATNVVVGTAGGGGGDHDGGGHDGGGGDDGGGHH
jgi:uncharacterized membrane protein YgcG